MATEVLPGIYSVEYFSGSQVACYIGDILIDEITSMSYEVVQQKQPLYGYSDTLFRQISRGQRFVQGTFSVNFKEAGYLWLALNQFIERQKLEGSVLNPLKNSSTIDRQNLERIVDAETTTFERVQKLTDLAAIDAASTLGGFASRQRFLGLNSKGEVDVGTAENKFEQFEDLLWQKSEEELNLQDRSVDDTRLNGFDIYLAYGDFAGDNRNNHTFRKIVDVHITGWGQQIQIAGMPIQESYTFVAKNII